MAPRRRDVKSFIETDTAILDRAGNVLAGKGRIVTITSHGEELSRAGLRQLDAYKYVSGTCTWGDDALNPFWEYCVTLLPPWLAPNLVTFLGFLVHAFAHVLIAYLCPRLEAPPRLVSILAAVCLFIYNTMDAIDGKQARRTKASSPLGQLFDHGCDAVTSCLLVINMACALEFGASYKSMLLLLGLVIPFYLSQWEEYHTHQMRTNVNRYFGVTEAQYLAMALLLLSGTVPSGFWSHKIGGLVSLGELILFSVMLAPVTFTDGFLSNTLPKAADKTEALLQLSPPILLLTAGVLFASVPVVVNKVIVCSTTRMRLSVVQPLTFVPLAAFLFVFMGVPAQWVMWPAFVFIAYRHLRFSVRVIDDITRYLGIYVFRIGRCERTLVLSDDTE